MTSAYTISIFEISRSTMQTCPSQACNVPLISADPSELIKRGINSLRPPWHHSTTIAKEATSMATGRTVIMMMIVSLPTSAPCITQCSCVLLLSAVAVFVKKKRGNAWPISSLHSRRTYGRCPSSRLTEISYRGQKRFYHDTQRSQD